MDIKERIERMEKELAELKRETESEGQDESINWDEMNGRLVMVKDECDEEWKGPVEFTGMCGRLFNTTVYDWEQAKLYTGPTCPNWIEWSGGECPVKDDEWVLIETNQGCLEIIRTGSPLKTDWSQQGRIARYTVIEP